VVPEHRRDSGANHNCAIFCDVSAVPPFRYLASLVLIGEYVPVAQLAVRPRLLAVRSKRVAGVCSWHV
jgi:hypothetical protein